MDDMLFALKKEQEDEVFGTVGAEQCVEFCGLGEKI